jgi:hypothetical protein
VAGRNITTGSTVKNGEKTEEWKFTVFINLQNKFNFTEGKKTLKFISIRADHH